MARQRKDFKKKEEKIKQKELTDTEKIQLKNNFFSSEDVRNQVSLGTDTKPTLPGVISRDDIWLKICRRWKVESTINQYLRHYQYFVFSEIGNKPIREITKDDCDKVIDKVIPKRKQIKRLQRKNDMAARRHIEVILAKAIEAAAEKGLCEDVLWGSLYKIAENTQASMRYQNELVVMPKSLEPEEEWEIADQVLNDPTEDGEKIGVAIMFCIGGRENEVCGLNFGDVIPFKCDGNRYYIQIIKTSAGRRSTQLKAGGKTRNAGRLVPLPDRLVELLLKRRAIVEAQVGPESVETLPIVCVGDQYKKRCTPERLGFFGTKILRQVSMVIKTSQLDRELAFIDENYQRETEEAELLPGEVEKDPTAYLFRRNVATHLSILGLRRNEIEYIMGHDIEDERDSRNFFRNEDKLYPIAIKMHERPVVNHLGARQVALEDDKRPLILNDVSRATIHIAPDPKAAYSLYIREHEPNGKLKVTFRSDDNESRASILGTYKASPFDSEYQDKATMLISYHERYEAARERVKKINQQQEKSDDNLHSKTSSTK